MYQLHDICFQLGEPVELIKENNEKNIHSYMIWKILINHNLITYIGLPIDRYTYSKQILNYIHIKCNICKQTIYFVFKSKEITNKNTCHLIYKQKNTVVDFLSSKLFICTYTKNIIFFLFT